MGRFEESFDYYEQALRLNRADGNLAGEATALRALAQAQRASGKSAEALESVGRALGLFQDSGKRRDEALTLTLKAQALMDSARAREALSAGSSALTLCRAASIAAARRRRSTFSLPPTKRSVTTRAPDP